MCVACKLQVEQTSITLEILGAFSKTAKKKTIKFVMSACPSVRPHGTTRLPLDGFS